MFALTCLTISSDVVVLPQKSLSAFYFSMVESRGKVKTSSVASCCWPEVYYWTEHYPVVSITWFIQFIISNPCLGQSTHLSSLCAEKQFTSCHLLARNLLVEPTGRNFKSFLHIHNGFKGKE